MSTIIPTTAQAMNLDFDPELVKYQENYGDHIAISTVDAGKIRLVHRAKFMPLCTCMVCDKYDGSKNRKYFWVLENALERNFPSAYEIACFRLPPNCFCPGVDVIKKDYYDRGPFDRQTPAFKSGCVNGGPTIFAGPTEQVCCCMDCCSCWNYYVTGYFVCCVGERISILPYDRHYYCCSTRANWCTNCCSLCGPKSGQPLPGFFYPLAINLSVEDAPKLADSINKSRETWKQRTGIF